MPVSIHSLRGATRLAFDCVGGVTRVVERMHRTLAERPHPLGRPADGLGPTRCGGTAGLVYATLQDATALLRECADLSLACPPLGPDAPTPSPTESRVVAALNGVCGDHLASTGNPLATAMSFSTPAVRLNLTPGAIRSAIPRPSRHVAVLAHGLCLSDQTWYRRDRPFIGASLEKGLDVSTVFLRYNTGRRISHNGHDLASMLAQLIDAWPLPVESLVLIGHSMGGLVLRSACFYADRDALPWLERLRAVVCLGSPHHGAPLEKAGHFVTALMKQSPYTAPLAVGERRSAGIKDLRHGNLRHEDWQAHAPDSFHPDARIPVPLMDGVTYYLVAATVGQAPTDLKAYLLGDLLVPVGSAFGYHRDDLRRLRVRPEHSRVFPGRSHFDLLHDAEVHAQLVEWLTEPSRLR